MKHEPLRLVAHTIKPINGFDERLLAEQELLFEAAEIAMRNKIFLAFYEGLVRLGLTIPKRIQIMAEREGERKRIYEEILNEIVKAAEQKGIRFMIFKSIKPFTYIGCDVDFFLPNDRDFKLFIELLSSMGFRLINSSPTQVDLSKNVYGIHVIADVHRAFSASSIPYVTAIKVWERRVACEFNGLVFFTPSLSDEMLILAGHSLLKEFRMNLADFYHATFLAPKINWKELSMLAQIEGMKHTFTIFMYVVNRIYRRIYNTDLLSFNFSDSYLLKIAYRTVEKSLRNVVQMPYYYPLSLPVIAYYDKLITGIMGGGIGSSTLLSSLIKAPFVSRGGIGTFWKYIIR
jgi:hypothetical protein